MIFELFGVFSSLSYVLLGICYIHTVLHVKQLLTYYCIFKSKNDNYSTWLVIFSDI